MNRIPLLLALLLFSPPALAGPAVDLDPGWSALALGDLDAAGAVFEQGVKKRKTRADATAGLLLIATARADDDTMRALLKDLDPARSTEALILAAGAAELALVPATGAALPWAEAACAVAEPVWPEDTRGLCTMAPLLRSGPRLSRCVQGCDTALSLPFSYAGSQPVVLVSINGGDAVPLLVDTGASGSLLTEEAAKALGLEEREHTSLQISATGGLIPSWRAIVTLELGGTRLEDVQVLVADLPIGGLAGILSPQDAWPGHVVELDFVNHELRVAPAAGQPLAGVALPYRQHETRPYVELRTQDRPPLPVVIDTGASHTHVDQAWEAMGEPLKRLGTEESLGAGGTRSQLIHTEGRLDASAGELSLPLLAPALYTPQSTDAPGVRNHGLLGADVWMGRVLSIDRSGRRLAMTTPAVLSSWEPGDEASWSVVIDGAPAGRFTERVVGADDGAVTLEVDLEVGESTDRLRVRIPDTWASRGTWMLTRPVLEAWALDDAGEQPLEPGAVVGRWLPLFKSFGTVPGAPPSLVFGEHDVGGKQLACTRLEMAAVAGDEPATFSMLECPTLPWRTVELGLVDADGVELWRVRRE
jgi:hypothetical protein